jgi:hypothetical protein
MPTFETTEKNINLNATMQDAIDEGRGLVLTVGVNNYAKLSIEAAVEEETTNAR